MKLIVVRHCKANGQESEAQLTEEGLKQAEELAGFLKEYEFDAIFSSPFVRAVDSIKPFSDLKGMAIQTDDRLIERVLSAENDPEWRENLRRTYVDEYLTFPGGESTYEAKQRILTFLENLKAKGMDSVLVVTHGNLMSLLLSLFQPMFGFEDWALMTNPDVYQIDTSKASISRLYPS
jgi:2,3-bisphosphoglycerate-dependent phosphoglycerate mutase